MASPLPEGPLAEMPEGVGVVQGVWVEVGEEGEEEEGLGEEGLQMECTDQQASSSQTMEVCTLKHCMYCVRIRYHSAGGPNPVGASMNRPAKPYSRYVIRFKYR